MIEVLKQMVEALENDYTVEWPAMNRPKKVEEKRQEAIQAGKQAIAELESQEPVAWADMGTRDVDNDAGLSWTTGHFHTTPLYIHPPQRTEPVFCEYCGGNDENPPDHCMDCARPQRTWVGLTDEEIEEIRESTYQEFIEIIRSTGRGKREPKTFVRAIEAKLKEKNS
jgi:hypothetical protein